MEIKKMDWLAEKKHLVQMREAILAVLRITRVLQEEYNNNLGYVERALDINEALNKMNEKYDKLDSLAEQRNKLFPTNRTSDRKVEK